MDTFSACVPRLMPRHEAFISGRRSCKGCGKALSARIATKAISASQSTSKTLPLQASLNYDGYAYDPLSFDAGIEQHFATAEFIDSTCAKKNGAQHTTIKKVALCISRQVFLDDYLAHARVSLGQKHALYICFDNEPYINELIHTAGPQPFNLNETPFAVSDAHIKKIIHEKNIPPGISEEGFTYIATACPSYPSDFIKKIHKGAELPGNAFILVLTPCPTGWISPPRLAHKVGLSAVQTGYFPLYEKNNGDLRITEFLPQRRPLQEFLALQKRFFTFPPQLIDSLQEAVDSFYDELTKMHIQNKA